LFYNTKVSSTPLAEERHRAAQLYNEEIYADENKTPVGARPAGLFGTVPAIAGESSCIDCHGNADIMKTLVPPPVASSGEGEG
jgi:hypothetical protein